MQRGFSLQELITSVVIAGVVAVFAIPLIFHSTSTQEMTAKKEGTVKSIIDAMQIADSDIGLLPQNFGPAKVLARYANQANEITSPGNSIGGCPTGQGDSEKTYQTASGVIITNVADEWLEDADRDPSNGKKPGDLVCLALKGKQSNPDTEVAWLYIPRPEAHTSRNLSLVEAADPTLPETAPVAPPKSYDGVGLLSTMYDGRQWSELFGSVLDQFLDNNKEKDIAKDTSKSYVIVMFDKYGRTIQEMEWESFGSGLTVDGKQYKKGWWDFHDEFRNDPDMFAKNNYRFTDGTTDYNISAGFFSPVKINLNGQDARLNSDDQFPFDIDGFNANKVSPVKTAGGINTDEAWLVTDRAGNGLFQNGILDGEDVFGDHLGKYRSGYEDLAALYQHQLKTDEKGQRYIPLKPLAWWEKLWLSILRLFGQYKQWDANLDLKLLDRQGKLSPASEVLTKVYVDYKDVSELDKEGLNWIRQRAVVEYTTGKTAQSADQWFQALTLLTPVEEEKAQ